MSRLFLVCSAGFAVALIGVLAAVSLADRLDSQITPVVPIEGLDPNLVALGRSLFHAPELSDDGSLSCASCHNLAMGGHDARGTPVSVGLEGALGKVNSPTVYNVDMHFRQFWDGRALTLHDQIDGPVQTRFELGATWPEVVLRILDNDELTSRFEQALPSGREISRETIKMALVEFMRSLRTPDSRFDQWLLGDDAVLTEQEIAGYEHFRSYGCVACHHGAAIGGNMFQVFGVLNDYFVRRGNIREADNGRFNQTGNPADRHVFKVPSLRMVRYTAPYFHDGSRETLRDAVDAMFTFQLGREAPDEHKVDIVAFLKTLAGSHPELKVESP